MGEGKIEKVEKLKAVSSVELYRLFLHVLPSVELPDHVSGADVASILEQKVARHDRAEARKRDKQRALEEQRRGLVVEAQELNVVHEADNDRGEEMVDEVERATPDPALSVHFDNHSDALQALAKLRDFARGTRTLTILDPYLFQYRETNFYQFEEDYVDKMCSIIPNSARRLTLVSTGFSTPVKHAFMRRLRDGREVNWISQNRFHDRLLIRDDNQGLLFGNSGGGFGSKGFLILEVPEHDIRKIKAFLFDLDRE